MRHAKPFDETTKTKKPKRFCWRLFRTSNTPIGLDSLIRCAYCARQSIPSRRPSLSVLRGQPVPSHGSVLLTSTASSDLPCGVIRRALRFDGCQVIHYMSQHLCLSMESAMARRQQLQQHAGQVAGQVADIFIPRRLLNLVVSIPAAVTWYYSCSTCTYSCTKFSPLGLKNG
eukprot:SAG11_NODE_573_length_8438_cov_22.469601_8_plen_172_part_00